MARNSEEESCKGSEEDEALSLSDLPLNFINEETSLLQSSKEATPQVIKENEEEFNFDSRGGSLSAESEMYAADEVFFKGQMLPVRLSVSSDSGLLARFEKDTSSSISRSESLDRGIRNTTTNSRPKIRNQFHSFPSPKPQIRVSNARLLGNGIIGSRSQKATVWDIFRLGLVRAPPEIELHNINSSVSRNSSSGSSSSTTNSSSSVIVVKNKQDLKLGKHKQQQKKQSFLDKRKGLFSGCRCSIAAVETVPLNNIDIIKSNNEHESSSNKESNSRVQDMEKKLQEMKIKKKNREKQAMSRHRTFEWLKELSHADGNLLV